MQIQYSHRRLPCQLSPWQHKAAARQQMIQYSPEHNATDSMYIRDTRGKYVQGYQQVQERKRREKRSIQFQQDFSMGMKAKKKVCMGTKADAA